MFEVTVAVTLVDVSPMILLLVLRQEPVVYLPDVWRIGLIS